MPLFTRSDLFYEEPLDILQNEKIKYKAEMSAWQQSFVCGLMKEKRPKKLLEVGVSAGGTTAVILNCMHKLGLKDSTLYSVDISPDYYLDKSKPVGYLVKEEMPQLADRWCLKTGHHISHWLDEIGGEIDFLVLDTAHVMPGELLDFICILPFLAKDAVVVLHDLHLFDLANRADDIIATHVLFQTVVADKILCPYEDQSKDFANLGAFRITEDTLKYREQLFYALSLPWKYGIESPDMHDIQILLDRLYHSDCREMLDRCQERYFKHLFYASARERILTCNDIGLWGAGNIGKVVAQYLRFQLEEQKADCTVRIADKDASRQGEALQDLAIESPQAVFKGENRARLAMVCIQDETTQEQVRAQLLQWGYAPEQILMYEDFYR